MATVTPSARRPGRLTAAVISAASHRRLRPGPPAPVLRIPADQMPPLALERLRHPSTPPQGFLVRWDPDTMTAVWQPCAVRP